jgi:hypothetical protein
MRTTLAYSHSIVPGGLLVMSYTTRLTPLTSLMMRVATWETTDAAVDRHRYA